MSSRPALEPWGSSSSRLIGFYALFFVAWGALFTGVLYWQISQYLGSIAERTLMQRAHYYAKVDDENLLGELAASEAYSTPNIDAYGLFDAQGQHLAGDLLKLRASLPDDGQVHYLQKGLSVAQASEEPRSSYALLVHRGDGRMLVLARDGGSVSAVGGIIQQALAWGLSLTLIPGLIGWRLLRRRPLKRVQGLQRSTESVVSGNLADRLPLSPRRDELDMLASAVNTMLDHIEQLMLEVKGVCDGIAHDLRTPLTRLRARLHQLDQMPLDAPQRATLEQALAESESIMVRFQGLLRVAELEDTRRRGAFQPYSPLELLQQAHEFYEPLALERQQTLTLDIQGPLPTLMGDVALLFEALVNLLDNAIKFTPVGGAIVLRARCQGRQLTLDILDTGPGIAPVERSQVIRRLYRGPSADAQPGHGLGLSLVAAIVRLHGYTLHIGSAEGGGAQVSIHCAT